MSTQSWARAYKSLLNRTEQWQHVHASPHPTTHHLLAGSGAGLVQSHIYWSIQAYQTIADGTLKYRSAYVWAAGAGISHNRSCCHIIMQPYAYPYNRITQVLHTYWYTDLQYWWPVMAPIRIQQWRHRPVGLHHNICIFWPIRNIDMYLCLLCFTLNLHDTHWCLGLKYKQSFYQQLSIYFICVQLCYLNSCFTCSINLTFIANTHKVLFDLGLTSSGIIL